MKYEIGDEFRRIELANCTFVKTVIMIIVVLYHSICFWSGNWFICEVVYKSNILWFLVKYLNTFHIYAFTLVSGYLFYYLRYEKEKYRDLRPFIANKAKCLLIPYIFVATVWVIPSARFFDYDIDTIFNKYVLATSPNQLWFLVMLFNVFVIIWLLSDFFCEA